MLIITRSRKLQAVRLTDKATGKTIGTVSLMDVGNGKARIGFEFPDSIVVDREEFAREKDAQKAKVPA